MTNVRMRRFFLLVGFLCLSAVVNAAVIGWKDEASGLWVDWIDKNTKEEVKVIQAQNNESYSGAYTIPSTIPSQEDANISVSIKQIAQQAFKDASGLTDVVIEAGIWQIDYETFRNSGLKSIVIPSSVTRIAMSAFANTQLTAINIPESVTEIYGNAFGDCVKLQRATFANVKALCNISFYEVKSNPLYYAKRLYFANDLENPVSELTIPGEVTTIKKFAFYNCESLTNITIAEGVESIEESTFCSCANLTTIGIPSTITTIGVNAFAGDNKLCAVRYASIECLCTIDYANLSANPLYLGHKLYIGNNAERAVTVSIPASSLVNGSVRPYILAGAQGLEKITLPKEATAIGASAFIGCTGLKYAEYNNEDQLVDITYSNSDANPLNYAKELLINGTYPTSITIKHDINPNAFYNAQWLEAVTIKEGVTTIGAGAFMNCKKLALLKLPSSLTTIGANAFNSCEALQNPSLPDGLQSIGNNAFYNCKGKSFTKISIPANCTIATGAFKLCSELITVSQMPTNLTSIPENCFENCYKLSSITIPNTVTTIKNSAFRNCRALTNIPYGTDPHVTEIGESAFAGCTGFTEVEIKQPVSIIKSNAFNGCSNMTMINLPATITEIRLKVFSGCAKLANVIVNSDEAPLVGDDAFDGNQSQMHLYVKEAAKSSFAGADVWKDFNNGVIEKYGEHTITFYVNDKENKIITLPVGTTLSDADRNYKPAMQEGDVFSGWDKEIPLTMPSTNVIIHGYLSLERVIEGKHGNYTYRYKYHLQPDEEQNQKLKRATLVGIDHLDENDTNIEIPANVIYNEVTYPVQAIGVRAFAKYNGKGNIMVVNLPESNCITVVDTAAFKGCNNLTEVKHFDGITHVRDSVFYNCSNLSTITLSDNVSVIDELAFYGCSSLNLVSLPSKLDSINYQALANTGIETVTIAKRTFLGDEAFKGCAKLTTVVFADEYDRPLPKLAFWNCISLNSVTLRGTMGSIHEGAFRGCNSLAIIDIPTGISQLGNEVFMGCTKLTKVTLPASGLAAISQSAFSGCSSLTDIMLPNTIDNIRQKAFIGCSKLTNITVKSATPPTLIENAFDDATYTDAKIYVNNVTAYQNQDPWNRFGENISPIGNFTLTYIVDGNTESPYSIKQYAVGDAIQPLIPEVKDGHEFSGWAGEPETMPGENIVVTGKYKYRLSFSFATGSKQPEPGNETEFSLPEEKWYFYGDAIKKDSLEKVLKWAGYDYDNIVIPATMPANDVSIQVMYRLAEQTTTFTYQNKTLNYKVYLLENKAEVIASPDVTGPVIIIPATITYNNESYPVKCIQNGAFEGNRSITNLTIEADIDSIGSRAFFDNKFTSFTIPANVERIGADAFLYCTSMKTLTFDGNKITKLPSGVFRNCYALEEVDLPESITKIGKSAFAGSSKLSLITINSESMPEADVSAFDQNQYNFTKLRVPASIDVNNLPDPWNRFADRAHTGEESTAQKCATPTVTYDKGKLTFTCTTPGAEIYSWIEVDDAQQNIGGEWDLVKVYKVKAYATKTGWRKSDEIKDATITWCNGKTTFGEGFKSVTLEESNPKRGDVNEDGAVDAQDASVILQYVAKKITW